jgi:CheY-like chemotaxis protein
MKTINILLVDDDEDDRFFLMRLLEKSKIFKYSIVEAENYEQALAAVKKSKIDCAILDYHMPVHNGLEIMQAMQVETGHYLATVILTGDPDQDTKVQAAQKGAIDYLAKDLYNTPEKIDMIIDHTMQWAHNLNHEQIA